VEALVNNVSKLNTTVGKYTSGYYLVDIPGNTNDNVTFRVFGIEANPTNTTPENYSSGDYGQVDLLVHLVASGGSCPLSYLNKPSTGNIHNGCSEGFCVHDTCRAAATNCGDGYCDAGESCAADNSAGCDSGYACTNGCVATSSSGGGSSGGGGGGGAAADEEEDEEEEEEDEEEEEEELPEEEVEETQTTPSIEAGASGAVAFVKADLAVTEITINAKSPISTGSITVTKKADKPAEVSTPSGKVYIYMTIEHPTISNDDIESTKITFEVTKTWISANNIDPDTIILQRYFDGAWEQLTTTKTGESATIITYEAESPGLSTFVITGNIIEKVCTSGEKKCSGSNLLTCKPDSSGWYETVCPLGCENGNCKSIAPMFTLTPTTIGIVIAMIIVIIVAIYFYTKRGKRR